MSWMDHSLTGIVIGFVLGIVGTAGLDIWRDRRTRRRVRRMLRLEIGHNLAAISELDERLPRPGKEPTVHETAEQRSIREWSVLEHRARAIVDLPVPHLERTVWTAQIAFMPQALTEDEVSHVSAFYDALGRYTILHDALVSAYDASEPLSLGDNPLNSVFIRRITQTRNEIMHTIQQGIDSGAVSVDQLDDTDKRVRYLEGVGWARTRWRRLRQRQ